MIFFSSSYNEHENITSHSYQNPVPLKGQIHVVPSACNYHFSTMLVFSVDGSVLKQFSQMCLICVLQLCLLIPTNNNVCSLQVGEEEE